MRRDVRNLLERLRVACDRIAKIRCTTRDDKACFRSVCKSIAKALEQGEELQRVVAQSVSLLLRFYRLDIRYGYVVKAAVAAGISHDQKELLR